MKTIEYYVREVYGNPLEYVKSEGDADVIRQLTGKRTVNPRIRELIRDLSGGLVEFKQILPPCRVE